MTFEQTVRNTRLLFESARRAGVGRIVHIGVTNASVDSGLPYYRGKALQEKALRESGVSHAIVRPTLVFGGGDILVNNIAWLLRRFPYFPIGGSGRYRLQPVHVDDVATIAIACAKESRAVTVDAIGPEAYTFDEFVRLIASAVRPSARLIHLPPAVVTALGRLVGLGLGDVILTRAELQGLMDEMLTSKEAPNGSVRFSEWLAKHREEVGASYASELGRHFDWKGNPSDRAA